MQEGVIEGSRVKRYVDLSTVGSQTAVQIHDHLAERNIVAIDSPVSGGVSGAEKGALAVMVSGPRNEFDVDTKPRSKRSAGRSTSAKNPAQRRP